MKLKTKRPAQDDPNRQMNQQLMMFKCNARVHFILPLPLTTQIEPPHRSSNTQ